MAAKSEGVASAALDAFGSVDRIGVGGKNGIGAMPGVIPDAKPVGRGETLVFGID